MRRHDVPQRCFSPVLQGGTPGADSNRTRAPERGLQMQTHDTTAARKTAYNAETRDRTGDLQQLSYRGCCAPLPTRATTTAKQPRRHPGLSSA